MTTAPFSSCLIKFVITVIIVFNSIVHSVALCFNAGGCQLLMNGVMNGWVQM